MTDEYEAKFKVTRMLLVAAALITPSEDLDIETPDDLAVLLISKGLLTEAEYRSAYTAQ